jgi:hypothetical protein
MGTTAAAGDLRDDLLDRRGYDVGDQHRRTFCCETSGDRFAEPGASAGHHHHLIVESLHVPALLHRDRVDESTPRVDATSTRVV